MDLPDDGQAPAIVPKRKPRSTTSRPKRKTFTGCWTCRSRHVKCDEQRPECKRCLAGNFTCRGYDVRLNWVSSAGKVLPKGNRRVLSQYETESSAGGFSPDDVRTALHRLDGSSRASSITTGPFSVFLVLEQHKRTGNNTKRAFDPASSSQTKPIPRAYQSSSGLASEGNVLDFVPEIDNSLDRISIPPQMLNATNDLHSQDLEQLPSVFDSYGAIDTGELLARAGTSDSWIFQNTALNFPSEDQGFTEPSNTEFAKLQSSHPHSMPSRDSNTTDSSISASWNLRLATKTLGQPERHLDLLPAPAQQRELINHWVTSLCDRLMPIRNIMNPFRIVVAPMALQGSRMTHDKSSSTVAVFHAVCAASAIHQSILRGGHAQNDALALQHRNSSFVHLMSNIHSNDADERLASLATLCIWLLSYFISGAPGAWREVIKVARNLVEQTSMETWTHSASAALTYQCYSALVAMIQSQYLGRKEYLAPMNPSLTGSDHYKYSAIPSASLQLISSFNASLLQGGTMDPEELDRLEIEFALSVPSASEDLALTGKDLRASHHHNHLFYYACLLYFRRNSGRTQRELEIQDLVGKCLEHIEYLDAMQLEGNPLSWIYATAAFEAGTLELRDRVRASFARRKSLGFATWATLLLAAEEVWKTRDEGLLGQQPEPWQRILAKSPQFDVLLY